MPVIQPIKTIIIIVGSISLIGERKAHNIVILTIMMIENGGDESRSCKDIMTSFSSFMATVNGISVNISFSYFNKNCITYPSSILVHSNLVHIT